MRAACLGRLCAATVTGLLLDASVWWPSWVCFAPAPSTRPHLIEIRPISWRERYRVTEAGETIRCPRPVLVLQLETTVEVVLKIRPRLAVVTVSEEPRGALRPKPVGVTVRSLALEAA